MSTAEVPLYSRRELGEEFIAFVRKRKRPSRQPHPARNGGSSSPHGWGGIQVTRGQFIGGLLITIAAASLLKPWERFAPQSDPEIDLYYPNLKSQTLRAKGEIHTAQTTTKWFNFTNKIFNPEVARITFDFFERLARNQTIIDYKIGNQIIPLIPRPKPRTQRVFFLIPEDAPLPSWPDIAKDASTTGAFENGPYVSFIRAYDSPQNLPSSLIFNTLLSAFSKAFSVEACQASVLISSSSTDMANLGQEIFANSYGSAFTIKQMALSYETYSTWAQDVLIRKDPESPLYPLYVLSEKEYSNIPIVGSVLG